MRASFLLKYFLMVSDGFLVAIANAVGGDRANMMTRWKDGTFNRWQVDGIERKEPTNAKSV